jgi:phage FluMu gp28-like protein
MAAKEIWPASRSKTPPVLLPYQQRWIEDQSEVKFCEKSRRIGLTWGEAADDVLLAAREDGMDVLYISYNYDMTREYVDTCAFWAKHFSKAASEIEEFLFEEEDPDGTKRAIKSFRIVFASGFEIMALSSRPKNLRGKQGRLIIDEAAFVDELADLMKAALAFLIWGGQVIVISTHFGDDNDFNQLIEEIRAGKKPYSLHRIDFDEALEDGLYQRICLVRGIEWTPEAEVAWRTKIVNQYGDDADEELFCIPSASGGSYLPRTLIASCMERGIPVLAWTPPKILRDGKAFVDWPDGAREAETLDWLNEEVLPLLEALDMTRQHRFGEDFARDLDLTVIWPLEAVTALEHRVPFGVELRDVPFSQQEQILTFVVDRLPRFVGGALDARGNGQYLAERARQKYGEDRIHEVMLTTSFYRENFPKYKAAFEDKTITIPDSTETMDDHRAVKKVKGVPCIPDKTTGKQTKASGKRHGDSAIAGLMAWYAVENIDGGPAVYGSNDPESTERMVAHNLRNSGRGRESEEDDSSAPARMFGGVGQVVRIVLRYGRDG